MSLALLILHITIIICLFTRDSFAKFVNEQCFPLKIIAVLVITFLLMFVDNSWMEFYVGMSEIISIVFLIYQSITLIDFGYVWNETWLEKYENGTTFYMVLMGVFSILLLGSNIYLLYFNFLNFWLPDCVYNKINLVTNVVVIIVLIVLVVLNLNESSSILTAFFITTILTYFNGLSLASYLNPQCNSYIAKDNENTLIYNTFFHIAVNLVLALITCLHSSLNVKSSEGFKNANINYLADNSQDDSMESDEVELNGRGYNRRGQEEEDNDIAIYKTNEYVFFHLIMLFFAIYLVMLFFDWRTVDINFDKWTSLKTSNPIAFYAKTINNLIFLLLYIWTLIAPAVLKDREFD